MKKASLLIASLFIISGPAMASKESPYFGKGLCKHPDFYCAKANTTSWEHAFPDPIQRDIVQKVNRTYNRLWRGKILAIPKDLENITLLDVAPFPTALKLTGERRIIVDQEKLAWGAYDEQGKLINWGPISSGKDYCADIGRQCTTQTGEFRIFSKQDEGCRSRTFDDAKMPYCMFFYKGFALHGSHDIPGHRASHGCVRLFTRDAKWLNQEFVTVSHEGNRYKGTKVIIRKLSSYD